MNEPTFTRAQKETLLQGLRTMGIPGNAQATSTKRTQVAFMKEQQVDDVFLALGHEKAGEVVCRTHFDLMGEPEGAAQAVVRELAAIFLSQ